MRTKIRKNEEYSLRMLSEGAETPVEEESEFIMKLPEWADEKQVELGQRFFLFNLNAIARAMNFGFFAIAAIESIVKVLMFTRQSSTVPLAYRRFKVNGLHAQLWLKHPIKPGTIAWKSFETIRRMHVVINKRSTKADVGIISQKDLAITQFLFAGFMLALPDEFGVFGSPKEFQSYNHLMRLVGFMLGIKDEFNCCGETLEDTKGRLQAIIEDMIKPAIINQTPETTKYVKIAFDGMWYSDPSLNYESTMFFIKRASRIPGYHYFDSESLEHQEERKKIFDAFSLFTRFRIFCEVIIYEYLSQTFILRWIFNIFRMFMALFMIYPVLAKWKFGEKFAHVAIMKPQKLS